MSFPTPPHDLLGFGIVAVDDLIELQHFPCNGSKQPIQAKQRQGGGIAGTALVAAARLGARCAYGGMLGENDLSDFIRDGLKAEGIDVLKTAAPADAQPYHSIILVDRAGGERTILYSNQGVISPKPADIPAEWIKSSRGLFLDWLGLEAAIHASKIAHELGIPVFADFESSENEKERELLTLTDHLIVPLEFAAAFTGISEPVAALQGMAKTPRAVTAVTDGARGCWFMEGVDGAVRHQEAFKVDVVDTTGCGDVFHGAYAAAILHGRDAAQAVRFAAAAAARKATVPGGQAGIPSRAVVEAMLS